MTEQQAKALAQQHRQDMHDVTADMAATGRTILAMMLKRNAAPELIAQQIADIDELEQEAARLAT